MKLIILLAGILTYNTVSACVSPGLGDYLVYATEGITASASDYEGLVGSSGAITLANFKILGNASTCLGVSALGSISITDGSVDLGIESAEAVSLLRMKASSVVASNQRLSLRDSSIDGRAYAPDLVKSNASIYGGYQRTFINLHATHTALPAQMKTLSEGWRITAAGGTKIVSENGQRIINVRDAVSVVNLDPAFFSRGTFTVIKGNPSQLLVINIRGSAVTLSGFSLFLDGMEPSQILFNFPEATRLTIRNTGNGVEGLPGSVLAPDAELNFVEALITGQVLVKRINAPMKGERSGQVNAAYFFHTTGETSEGKPGKH